MRKVAVALLLTFAGIAQAVTGTKEKAPQPSPEQRQAVKLLETALLQANDFAPGLRAYALWQIGRGYQSVDAAKSRDLLLQAFHAASQIPDEDQSDRSELQQWIFRDFPPGVDTEPLLAEADHELRGKMLAQLANEQISKGHADRAMEYLSQVGPDDFFPYSTAAQLIRKLPADDAAGRQAIFERALDNFRRHTGRERYFGTDDLATLLGLTWRNVPPSLALEACDLILRRAKESDEPANISISGSGGAASFNSMYEYRVFELLPVLRQLDKDRADALLQDAQFHALFQHYPNGMASLDPVRWGDQPAPQGEQAAKTKSMGRFSIGMGGGGGGGDRMQADTVLANRSAQILAMAAKDPDQALAAALSLPTDPQYIDVRVETLIDLARSLAKAAPAVARDALRQALSSAASATAQRRADALLQAASISEGMGDRTGAAKLLLQVSKAIEDLYHDDTNAEDPNEALKAFWPSTAFWTNLIIRSYRIDPTMPSQIIAAVPDEEIQAVLRIAYADLLLDRQPAFREVMKRDRKGNTNFMTTPWS